MNIKINEQEKRSSFVFYEGFEATINVLPKTYQLDAYKALVSYGLKGVEPTQLNGVVRAVFEAFRHQIDANRVRYENGKKGGRPKGILSDNLEPKANQKQTKGKPNANVNANVNDNDIKENKEKPEVFSTSSFLNKNLTLDQRKDLFWQQLTTHVSNYGLPMITAFYNYWSENSANGKALRLDGEKYFALTNRLATWHSRGNK